MLLSIVICNYNYARFVESAIASAVGQNYPNTEVIVIDDGSTDDSPNLIRRWTDKVRAIFQPNRGQVAAYNRGFREARGQVILFLDSDDMLDRDAGARIIAAFEEPDVTKVHFRLRLVDVHGDRLGGFIPRRLSDGDVRSYLRRGEFYDSSPGSGNAYRREALARLLPLPEAPDDPHGADFFALQGVAQLGSVRALGPAPLGSYRVHVEHATQQMLFGNARLKNTGTAQGRYVRLASWLLERLGPDYRIPEQLVDFSIEKLVFADLVFGTDMYSAGLRQGTCYFRSTLARGIWRRRAPVAERIGLMGWAVAVLLLPREVGRPLARYVCNPACRGASPV